MPLTDLDRIAALLLVQQTRPSPREDALMREDFSVYARAPASTPGANSTNRGALAGGAVVFHKPVAGVNKPLAGRYRHSPISCAINECAAWRLARFLGSPWTELIPVTVMRYHRPPDAVLMADRTLRSGWGSLAVQQPGPALDMRAFAETAQCRAAAFLDVLMAQQDRHEGNFRFDSISSRLGLIDHGFAFATAGDPLNRTAFVEARFAAGEQALDQPELDALDRLSSSPTLAGLDRFLRADQVDGLKRRVASMETSGELLPPGSF